jgi:NADP-dependent 3-hydroxy acid dehydrogenase YdfG
MKNIIVTGCSKGVGHALCLLLLAQGNKVYGISRNACNINHQNFTWLNADVSNYDALKLNLNKNNITQIDVLVNNAGMGIFKKFENLEPQDWQQMLNVNVLGLMNMTHLVYPIMIKQKTGHIINISSMAGKEGIPEATAYCATKFAVRGFSKALFKESQKHGIKISTIYPGSIKTNFFENYPAVVLNDNMMQASEIANAIMGLINMPGNIVPSELEIRPLQMKM